MWSATFSASVLRNSIENPARKVASCCCLSRGFPLVSGGWLKELPADGSWRSQALFLYLTKGVFFWVWSGAGLIQRVPEYLSSSPASHWRSPLQHMEENWTPLTQNRNGTEIFRISALFLYPAKKFPSVHEGKLKCFSRVPKQSWNCQDLFLHPAEKVPFYRSVFTEQFFQPVPRDERETKSKRRDRLVRLRRMGVSGDGGSLAQAAHKYLFAQGLKIRLGFWQGRFSACECSTIRDVFQDGEGPGRQCTDHESVSLHSGAKNLAPPTLRHPAFLTWDLTTCKIA